MTNSRYGSHLPSLLNTVAYYCSQYFVKCRYNLSLPFTHFLMFLIIEGLARTELPPEVPPFLFLRTTTLPLPSHLFICSQRFPKTDALWPTSPIYLALPH